MPQQLRVVRCYQCQTFQSDIVKKAPKWSCKLCGSKQSLIKEFARGSGQECRLLVQQLSSRAISEEQLFQNVASKITSGELELASVEFTNRARETSESIVNYHSNNAGVSKKGASKWDSFCETREEAEEDSTFQTSNWNKLAQPTDAEYPVARKRDSNSAKSNDTTSRNVLKRPANSQSQTCLPLIDFHQMAGPKFKKQFKYKSENTTQNECSTSYLTDKSAEINEVTCKTTSNKIDWSKKDASKVGLMKQTKPLMNYGKKSMREETSKHVSNDESNENTKTEIHQSNSSSKWDKFVTKDSSDEEFNIC
ncbi:MRN complex-interacting protein [Sabethes cyaneus]|uniref:MRN complex-interacting protein n=1 Tax=Sabethes cyaneus TaxID=53552 RepID=UPI00237E53C9|nr:MRN complex-interacting protein [Sabethes cyaneus]